MNHVLGVTIPLATACAKVGWRVLMFFLAFLTMFEFTSCPCSHIVSPSFQILILNTRHLSTQYPAYFEYGVRLYAQGPGWHVWAVAPCTLQPQGQGVSTFESARSRSVSKNQNLYED